MNAGDVRDRLAAAELSDPPVTTAFLVFVAGVSLTNLLLLVGLYEGWTATKALETASPLLEVSLYGATGLVLLWGLRTVAIYAARQSAGDQVV